MKKNCIFFGYMTLILLCAGGYLFADSGDVNNNGLIDIVDALLIAQYYVDFNPEDFEEAYADVNCDTHIDIVDALLVAQYYVGLIDSFPCSPNPEPTPFQNSYSLHTKYSSIRSYPVGGGIFIIYIEPQINFSGNVSLTVTADPLLNASLNRQVLDENNTVSELTIFPDSRIELALYRITIDAVHDEDNKNIIVEADVMSWETGDTTEYNAHLYTFNQWLQDNRPDLNLSLYNTWTLYRTYPQTLIVEHITFLNDEWEIRLCYHVMIPPDDWSRLLVRKRGDIEATLALYRETADAVISETDISEYPIMYGY
jgi:hypothetical protein